MGFAEPSVKGLGVGLMERNIASSSPGRPADQASCFCISGSSPCKKAKVYKGSRTQASSSFRENASSRTFLASCSSIEVDQADGQIPVGNRIIWVYLDRSATCGSALLVLADPQISVAEIHGSQPIVRICLFPQLICLDGLIQFPRTNRIVSGRSLKLLSLANSTAQFHRPLQVGCGKIGLAEIRVIHAQGFVPFREVWIQRDGLLVKWNRCRTSLGILRFLSEPEKPQCLERRGCRLVKWNVVLLDGAERFPQASRGFS